MRKFCVYKHTTPSGKVYIGITSRKPKENGDVQRQLVIEMMENYINK